MANYDAYMLLDVVGSFVSSVRAPVGTVPACNCPEPVPPLSEVPNASSAPNLGPDYGVDVDAISDVPLRWNLCKGFRNLGNALARRLSTLRGALASDPSYGFDVRDMLSSGQTASAIGQLKSNIIAECEKDPRVQSIEDCSVAFNTGTNALTVKISGVGASGPFDLAFTFAGAAAGVTVS